MKKLTSILFLLSFTLISHSQNSDLIASPKAGDYTFFSHIDWNGEAIEFNNPRKVNWDFKNLRPSYIIKEQFSESTTCTNCITYHKENGVLYNYEKVGNQLKLVSAEEQVNFTNDQTIKYSVLGNYYTLPIATEERKGLNNEFTLVSYLSKENLNYEFDFIPKNTDSLKIEITISENNRQINNGILELYHFSGSASLIHTITRTSLSIKIKYSHSNIWYDYNYRVAELPRQLVQYSSKIPKTHYKYYCKDYVFPILMYDVEGVGAKNIRLQDKKNIFNVPTINYDEKLLLCNPDPIVRWANFYLSNFPISDYRIEVSNVIGKNVQKASFRRQFQNVFKMDMLNLPDGLYFYHFIDSNGLKSPVKYFSKISE